ncbi:XTP/dITP diphosphatase [Hazenella sp. IB182357]|uniref:dITP/XTP pyrophosphatase n=1 Tax=Polycladospora coralii TaxID=2771432 RepID=A0A926RSS5_9BACL|nr:XTP/dITP diphosphatase [Polycladospora coralii]MBD1371820.1 XTP/dITP diphosphatase [Polycladospora coralii]MBS7529281.1 XTP/dITP diphosphatase [Polycladospora coralii]
MIEWPYPYILVASGNQNKIKQFQDLFAHEFGLTVKGLKAFPHLPEIVEDRDTFEGNAIKKAESIAKIVAKPVISDDSGIMVSGLDGAPGVYSARYAGENATDAQNNHKLMEAIKHFSEEQRKAKFVCVMALAVPGQETQIVRGECEGVVIPTPRGNNGFGYDPLFYIPAERKTMAELSAERKYQISHRAKATGKLIQVLQDTYDFEQVQLKR